MPLDALPLPAPAPTDSQADFDLHSFALVAALYAFVTQANALEANVVALEAATLAASLIKNTDKYKGIYDPAVIYAQGESVLSGGAFWMSNVNGNLGNAPVEGVNWTMAGQGIYQNPTITNYTETVHTVAVSGAAVAIDLTLGTRWVINTSANCVITLPAPVAGKAFSIDVIFGGAHTLTWAAAAGVVQWPDSIVPPATSSAGKRDKYAFDSTDVTRTSGSIVGQNYPA